MKIVTNNLGVKIEEKYAWEYVYKGFIFFSIGLFFVWYKTGKLIYKFVLWFGKFTWSMIETIGKNYDGKEKKSRKKK